MSETESRLMSCFSAVFPKIAEAELINSSVDSFTDWDSLASVTLYTLIEEEFELEIPPNKLENLLSFELILEFVTNEQLSR